MHKSVNIKVHEFNEFLLYTDLQDLQFTQH